MPSPMHGKGPSVQKPKDFKGSLKKIVRILAPYKFSFILGLITAVISVVISVVVPKIMGNIITEIANGFMAKVQGTGGIDFDKIFEIVSLLCAVYALSAAFEYVQGFLMSGVSNKIGYSLRKEMNQKIDRLPLSYFDTHAHGDILSRFTNDVDTLVQSLNQTLSSLLSNFVRLIGFLVMMLSISWKMTLLALVIVPLSIIVVMFVVKRSQSYFKQQQKSLGVVNGHIEEMYSAHIIVKAFNGEKQSMQAFEQYNHALYQSAWKSQFLSGLMMPLTQFIGNLGYVGVCILGGYLAMRQEIALGDIQSFITYTRNFTQPINQISQSINTLQSTAAATERVFEFLDQEEQIPDSTTPVYANATKGQVSFENVVFGYEPEKTIIHNFSMYVKPGQTVAIVGPTGAGKTTIVKLLMRFYELNSGAIYIDGVNIKDMKRSDLRSKVGMVLQDAWLFEGTIMENLRFGKQKASDQQVIEACKLAHVDHFIHTLKHGYQTMLGNDTSNISQGQKQLLTIARAFLADPSILILDEATSSVDTRTEILIQKGMDELMKGRTSFVIAHRLSTIKNADAILVMDHGDIVEVGNHDQLMKKQGFYYNLYNAQFEGDEEIE
ncbi:ABC transporter ATP-binding protein [Faecalicoccus pleomorphus]|uniref:ABC transporter ATP-binding protein n=1 Tax=Faecalicoccus pleomorphus TaxID=1323 RepID=UPI00242B7549|nr:ABC transporter ATP-binding protein [Faecalicoccus pleomorphus]